MNDFTKEELLNLYAAMRHCYKQCIDLPSDTDTELFSYNLMEKIQSMIDNYDKQKPAIVFVRGESRDISEFYDE